ncbi:hypothetical protein HanIR_Chr03g0106941 [Helianthus annuus]|nr:hypothetical protein HanIR_Chr03g0106941 [Helianthus annuus]
MFPPLTYKYVIVPLRVYGASSGSESVRPFPDREHRRHHRGVPIRGGFWVWVHRVKMAQVSKGTVDKRSNFKKKKIQFF